MAKYTYGYPTDKDKDVAVKAALLATEAAEGRPALDTWTTEVLETDAHKVNNEFVVVVRTPEA